MSRCATILVFLLIATPATAQEPAQPVGQPRLDRYGDPLPAGALRRFGTVRFRQENVHDMAYTPDGKTLVVQSSDRLVQWDVATGKPLKTIPKSPLGKHRSLGLSRDGRLVAVRPDKQSVVVFELATGKELFRKDTGTDYPGGAISPDNATIAIGAENGTALWDMQTGERLGATLPTRTDDLRYSPNGKWLAARIRHESREDRIYLYDAKTGDNYGSINPIKPTGNLVENGVNGYEFTPDGKSLIVSWQGSGIVIHDLKSDKALHRIKTDAQFVALSLDGKILATAKERSVLLFSVETGEEIRRWRMNDNIPPGTHGAFAPDGKTLALGFEYGIQLWDPNTGKRLDPYIGPVDIANWLLVSDDAKTIAVSYGDETSEYLLFLDATTFQVKSRFDVPPRKENAGFTADGRPFRSSVTRYPTLSPNGRRLAFMDSPEAKEDVSSPPLIRVVDVVAAKEMFPEKEIRGSFSHWKGSDGSDAFVARIGPEDRSHWIAVDAETGRERSREPIPKNLLSSKEFANQRRGLFVADYNLFLAEFPGDKSIRRVLFSKPADDELRYHEGSSFSPDERLILTIHMLRDQGAFAEPPTGSALESTTTAALATNSLGKTK